ncbi:MAG: tetratricopeptide repeat protein [Ignavibacteria bacterium]|nr:tetratricopeptide repeat protein [Ignavibacteria bacterium]
MKETKFFILLILFKITVINAFAQDNLTLFRQYYRNNAYQEAYELLPILVKEKYKDEFIYLAFGDVYFEFEKYDSARIMYENAYNIRNDRVEIVTKLARAYSYSKNTDRGIKILKDYLKKNINSWEANLELGYVYLRADSLKQAEYHIAKARDLNPKTAEPLVALGDLYFAQKVYELARMNYEEALAINPELTDARIKLATAYYWLANRETDENLSNELFTRSLKEWSIVSQKEPKNFRAWFEQGKILFLARRFEDAARALYQYVQLRSTGSLGRWYLAQSLVEIAKCDSAIPHLQIVANEIDSVKFKAILRLARCYFDTRRFEESISTYNQLKNNKSETLEDKDYERLASSYLQTGDTTQALKIYNELLELKPNRCLLAYQVGMLSYFAKRYNDATNFYNKYLDFCKDTLLPKVFFYLGNSYLNLNLYDSAISYFTKAISIEQSNPLNYIYRGDAYVSSDKKLLGKDDYITSIKIASENPSESNQKILNLAYSKLCNLLLDTRDTKELTRYAKLWSEIEPKLESPWIYLAISSQIQKDLPNACKYWKKVLQINPKNKVASDYYDQLKCQSE